MPVAKGKVKPRFEHRATGNLFGHIIHFVLVVQSRFAQRTCRVFFLNGAQRAIKFLGDFFAMRDKQKYDCRSQSKNQQAAHQIKKFSPQPRPPPDATLLHAAIAQLPLTLHFHFRQQRAGVHCHLHKGSVANCMPASITA